MHYDRDMMIAFKLKIILIGAARVKKTSLFVLYPNYSLIKL